MTWTKLDDAFWSNPKVVAAGNAATGAYARMLSYCGDHNTDGKVEDAPAALIATRGQLAKLEEHGLIERNGNGWIVPGYLEFNPSKAQVEKERVRARERMANVRANKA